MKKTSKKKPKTIDTHSGVPSRLGIVGYYGTCGHGDAHLEGLPAGFNELGHAPKHVTYTTRTFKQ